MRFAERMPSLDLGRHRPEASMDATELLKRQHAEVKKLFGQFERAQDEQDKRSVFEEIADDLAAHSEIEQKLFYPAVCVGDLKEELQEAVEQHLNIKRLIAVLLDLNAADESFDAKMKVLRDQVEHHVGEEEEELFPKVKRYFNSQELKALGTEMEAMFNEVKNQEPRQPVLSQTEEAVPLE